MLGGSNEAIKVREQGNAIRRRQKDNNIPELRRCVKESITWNDNMEQGNAKKGKAEKTRKATQRMLQIIMKKNESKKITLNKK